MKQYVVRKDLAQVDVKRTPGGLVLPQQPKKPEQIYTCTVYYMSDLTKFLTILDKTEWGGLLSVVKSWWPNGMSNGWTITYQATDPIEMEILC